MNRKFVAVEAPQRNFANEWEKECLERSRGGGEGE